MYFLQLIIQNEVIGVLNLIFSPTGHIPLAIR